jgi:hypothetical protein
MKAAGSVSKNKITPPQYVTKASKKWCLPIFIINNINGR